MPDSQNRTAYSASAHKWAAPALFIVIALIACILLVRSDTSKEKQIAYLTTRVEALARFQEDSIAWRKQLVRNDDALADWRKARAAEIAFQSSTTMELRTIRLEMRQMSCAVCVATGKRCKRFCSAPPKDLTTCGAGD